MRSAEHSPRQLAPGSWPHGCTVAVWPVVNIEHFVPGHPGPSIQPHLVHGRDIANYGWREYGVRVGFWRLVDVFAELDVRVTAALNAEVCLRHPDIAATVVARDWEVMAHGWDNTTRHHGMSRTVERDQISRTLDTLTGTTGQPVLGWLTPGFAVSDATDELLAEAGLSYTADRCDDDTPYWFDSPGGTLLAIPYSLETNDISLFLGLHYTAAEFAEALVDHVSRLVAENAAGSVVALGLHPFLVGQPGRVEHLRNALTRIAAMPNVWLTTGRDIYQQIAKERSA
jgi:peptidoglycan/xylan/chitin deacetylase (PgdA/CDA1 family)